MYEITRLVYDTPEGRRASADAFLRSFKQSARNRRGSEKDTRQPELLPVPLTADIWSNAILHRRVARDELVIAIIADRTASLMCHGLASLDDATLAFFAEHQDLLSRIAERSPALFAAFADGLHVRDNRVVPAGGEAAVPLWETVLLEKVTHPERFLEQLFELNDGRLAYLYDCAAQLDPPRRAFLLGLSLPHPSDRVDRFKLVAAGVNGLREWHVRAQPFGRPSYDLLMVFARIAVDTEGVPVAPAARGLWTRVIGTNDALDDGSRQPQTAADEEPFDAAWLVNTVATAEVRQRGERLDQIAFAQRVFTDKLDAPATGDAIIAIRGVRRYRMLIWTFERIGVKAPALYAAGVRHAVRLSAIEGRRGNDLQSQFQGALALVARAVRVGTIDAVRARTLVAALAAVPVERGRYAGGIATWLREQLLPALRPADNVETAVLTAMSGAASGESSPPAAIVWEGQAYRLDLGASELHRLRRVREKQDAVPLDVPLGVADAARRLTSSGLAADDVASIVTILTTLIEDVPQRSRHDEEDVIGSGLGATPSAHDSLKKSIDELTKAALSRDVKRVNRLAEPLADAGDALLGQVLVSLAYAADVGDPDGTVLLAGDVSHRHDFGLAGRDAELRLRTAWALPRQDVMPGQPWRVTGSLLGLDVALAPLALRRVNFERVLEAPRLSSNERDTFAVSVSLMNPFMLRDRDRDAIADAVARGRRRVQDLARDGHDLDPLADELAMEGWRRRALRWTLAHEAARVPTLLTLSELVVAGGAGSANLDPWGMEMLIAQGCLCSRLTPPGRWPTLLGRPQLGIAATGMPDLHLQVAIMLKELQLPAALARVVLSAAVQDFIDEVKPTDDADWLTLTRAARVLSRERVEDYIAAATALGPLVPATGRPAS
jgi:hypothetical protein